MATFLGVHDMGSAQPEEKMKGSYNAYKDACAKAGISAKHAHMNFDKGRAYCVTEANSADQVQKAHDDAGVPVNEILEVQDLS